MCIYVQDIYEQTCDQDRPPTIMATIMAHFPSLEKNFHLFLIVVFSFSTTHGVIPVTFTTDDVPILIPLAFFHL